MENSKQKKILFVTIIILLCAISVSILGVGYRNESQRAVDKISNVYLKELSVQASNYFDSTLQDSFQKMEVVDRSITESTLNSEESLQEFLGIVKEANEFYEIALVNNKGFAVSTTAKFPVISQIKDLMLLLNGEKIVATNETIWNQNIMLLGLPITLKHCEDNEFVAMIIGLDLEDLSSKVLVSNEEIEAYTSIINNDGSFVVKGQSNNNYDYGYNLIKTLNEKAVFDRAYSLEQFQANILNNHSGITSFVIEDYHEYLYYTPILNGQMFVFIEMPYEIIQKQISDLTTLVSVLMLYSTIIILVGITIVFVYYHKKSMRYHEQLLIEKDRAEKANMYKSNFLSQVSHEIRTPMNGIIGMTKIGLQNIEDPVRTRSCLEKIDLSSKNLLALINDILDMSKIESGKTSIYHEEFCLYTLIKELITTFSIESKKSELHLNVAIANDIENKLIGDSIKLRQILTNLLSNAIKFTKKDGTVSLDVKKIGLEDKKVKIRFVVEDTGKGILPENIDKIFELFMQEDTNIYKKYGGTGLGLPITKNFVEMMNGSITVESTIGVGSKFIVDIPFEYVESDIYYNPVYTEKMILLVSYNDATATHFNTFLSRKGFNVYLVGNFASGEELINELAKENKYFDCCLFEDNIDDAKYHIDNIRKNHKNDIFFYVFGYDVDKLEEIKEKTDIYGYIQRPISSEDIDKEFTKTLNIEDSKSNRDDHTILKGKKILIAEDNEINREIIISFLNEAEAIIDIACDGQVAYNKYIESLDSYDLILMDVQMPVMDGYTATRKIREYEKEKNQYTIILAMTANVFPDDVRKCFEAGMNGHISKPFDLEKICSVYKNILEN